MNKNKKMFVIGCCLLVFLNGIIVLVDNVKADDESNWWNDDWQYRKLITINHSLVDGDLVNFPILVYLDGDSDLVNHAQVDGDDVCFILYSDNITKLNHEIESYSDGTLCCWVNITSLSSSVDTKIWMYYGNNSCSSQQNIVGTWDGNFVAVYHMNDVTTSTIKDSKGSNNGTKKGANEPVQTTGKVGYGQDFDGSDDYITISSITIKHVECWINLSEITTTAYFLGGTTKEGVRYNGDTSTFLVYSGTGGKFTTVDYVKTDDIIKLDIIRTSNPEYALYVDGSYIGTSNSGSVNNIDITLFGKRSDGYAFNGIMDEIRFSNIIRNNSWINTTFNTMSKSGSFLSFGSEETHKTTSFNNPVVIFNEYPVNNTKFSAFINTDINKTEINLIWNATFEDPDGDLFTINITSDHGDTIEYNDCENGSYSLKIIDFISDDEYIIWVNATDGKNWTRNIYYYNIKIESIPILPGGYNQWRLVSLPINTVVIKYDVRIINDTNNYSWTEAVNNNIILTFLYGWNRTYGYYDTVESFSPYQGYWMFFYEDYELWIDAESVYNTTVHVYNNTENVTGGYEYYYDRLTGFFIWLNFTGEESGSSELVILPSSESSNDVFWLSLTVFGAMGLIIIGKNKRRKK